MRIDKRYAAGWAIGLVLHLGLAFIGYRATPVSGTTDDLIPIEIVNVPPPEVEEVIEEGKEAVEAAEGVDRLSGVRRTTLF